MPILDIQVIGEIKTGTKEMTQLIADQAGAILKARVGGTWVRLHFLPADCYAESGGESDMRPIFVSVLTGKCVDMHDRAHVAMQLANALSKITSRPQENIHILFEPEGVGRIAFGGKLMAK